MISRYSTPDMNRQFAPEMRFEYMKQVEIECARVQAAMGLIPAAAARDIAKKSRFRLERIQEIEQTTKHDVIAFVTNLAENVGKNGRYIHFGLTSSDVLDTALSLQIGAALEILLGEAKALHGDMRKMVRRYRNSICAGRTHGIYAEITTFGFKMAGFAAELERNITRLQTAADEIRICKLSGAVGTSSALPPEFERRVARRLKLQVENFATQVVPRDRHSAVLNALALLGSGYERLAVELRHLQRSEVSEVIEGFTKGQKGSSAMPHKKNPISAENITGLARLLRSYAQAGFENIALWHERDISHSSVERVVFPDAFQLAHYMTGRMRTLLQNLYVDEKRMFANTQKLGGVLYSSHLLLHLVEKKRMSREEAYALVQSWAHRLGDGEHLRDVILKDADGAKAFSPAELNDIFSGRKHLRAIEQRLQRSKNG